VADSITVEEFLKHIAFTKYLPSISGGRATWLFEGPEPLAVVATEFAEPWFLVSPDLPLCEILPPREPFIPFERGPAVTFLYFAQQSPEKVFRQFGGDIRSLPVTAKVPTPELAKGALLQKLFFAFTRRP
jgi:hypothetical protein